MRCLGLRSLVPLLLIAAAAVPVTHAGRDARDRCVPHWTRVAELEGGLTGVTAVAANDVWAVGHAPDDGAPAEGVIVHWDGTRWETIEPPVNGVLRDVDAVSAIDVWAVGTAFGAQAAPARPLVIRWNGSRWSRVRTPALPGTNHQLVSIDAGPRGDVWAVGATGAFVDEARNVTTHELTLRSHRSRWTSWRRSGETLASVVAGAPSAVWEVGSSSFHDPEAAVSRWDGRRWRDDPLPRRGTNDDGRLDNGLRDVDALTGRAAWAVGWNHLSPMIVRWDGRSWRDVPLRGRGELYAVKAVSARDVWAGGTTFSRALMMRWNGRAWRAAPAPEGGVVLDIDVLSPTSVWAVGRTEPFGHASRAFVAHYGC